MWLAFYFYRSADFYGDPSVSWCQVWGLEKGRGWASKSRPHTDLSWSNYTVCLRLNFPFSTTGRMPVLSDLGKFSLDSSYEALSTVQLAFIKY